MNNKKILITGGAGFIGSSFIDYIIENGFNENNIWIIDNLSTGKFENINPKINKAHIFLWDLSDKKLRWDRLPWNEFEYCFHFAALARVQQSYNYPMKYFSNNIDSTKNLIELLSNEKTKLINISSSTVISDLSSPYALSKKYCEELVNLRDNSITYRLSSIYGEKMDLSKTNSLFLGKVIRSIFLKETLIINNNGESIRSFTYINSICDFLFQLITFNIDINESKFKIFNIYPKNQIKILDIVAFIESLKIDLKIIFNKNKITEAQNNFVNNANNIIIPQDNNIFDFINKAIVYKIDYYKNRLKLWDGNK